MKFGAVFPIRALAHYSNPTIVVDNDIACGNADRD
jgi:hypothetical protein